MTDHQAISTAVANLYNTYPFPPEPLLDEPPIGYNWRWNWRAAYHFCTGRQPDRQDIRILDAGCGTGCGTEYLVYLNPQAEVTGIDLSAGALEVAKERCRRSVGDRATFHHLSLFDVDQLPGQFDLINCVGVLHHTPDPVRGIKALAEKLAPGGLFHIFVYGELGRWEIKLMQEAIGLLQGNKRGDYRDGVQVGRQIFASLPENNRLRQREKERWAMENNRDECFADMYVHPQEIDYNVHTLFDLIDASGLEFVGFSNPAVWNLDRLIGQSPELQERAAQLSPRDRYRLAEILDPSSFTHYEFFLAKPPFTTADWSSDEVLLQAIPERSPCMEGWESQCIFTYDYQVVNLSDAEFKFLKAADGNTTRTVAEIVTEVELGLDRVRALQQQQIVLLTPTHA
ncbi:class I SAM-dependent methyltransferase [Alkalinema sp. FACHB-956]|uniref:class I SAM-dependent methyltransferase n=1 Tax=Alkalinema sp. FACHB-956 TaxID=2692768 RepID=UPI001689E997|nr:class I SAM-dependent methyltransferase [Alkalinema sp. FACHB-956]MBD2330021.1 class I SAM-dependent methyltransferase [Alkalinema sp. FACHB-956]